MTIPLIIQPLLAGLSAGAFCLTYCFPFMAPLIAAEDRTPRKNVLVILEFLMGRLIGYLCFGLLAGYLGRMFDSHWLRTATNISFILLSLLLLLYLAGLVREKGIFCQAASFLKNKNPLLMGFLMGINICPPFLLSVAYVMARQSPFYGMLYFTIFFLSSSVYFLPLFFLGLLSRAGEFRTVARASGLLVALIFLVYGIYSVLHNN